MRLVPTSWSEDTGIMKRVSLYSLRKSSGSYEASAAFRELTGHVYRIKGYGDSRKAAKDDCRRRAKSSHIFVGFGFVPDPEVCQDFELVYSPPGAPAIVD